MICCGRTIEEAFDHCQKLEECCRQYIEEGYERDEQNMDCLLYTSGIFHPQVILRAVIKADDGLQPLGNTDGEGEKDLVHFHDDAGTCKGNSLSIDGQGAVVS